MRIEVQKGKHSLHKTILCADIIEINYLQNGGDLNPYISIRCLSGNTKHNYNYSNEMEIQIKFLKD